jgi:DNA (cytosine-5)-methyltransferase 1
MKLNILSLFDGMSCGQQALERAGIEVDNYFASEIDKYAMQVTMANYPDTKQLGSVVNVNGSDLPKIDLLIGGSPCQSFSFAGKRKGMATKCETEILTLNHYLELKADGYEFEGQSYLFWEFMRLLNECKPKYFLLENVEMGEKWEKVLSKAIEVNGIHINSALVSAQNRKRIYWTNIGMQPGGLFGDLVSIIQKPKNKGILLKDVLETEVDEKYFLSDKMVDYLSLNSVNQLKKGNGFSFKPTDGNKKGSAITNPGKNRMDDNYIVVHNTMPRSSTTGKGGTGHLSRNDGKTYCLDTGNTNAVEIVGLTEVRTQEAKQIRKETGTNPKRAKELILRTDGKIGAILTSQTPDNLVISGTLRTHNDGKGFRKVMSGKGATIPARSREDGSGQNIVSISGNIRRLTPLECERLQTVKDNYTNHVSDSQRYKMLGNGWTVDVIAHLFSYLK